MNVNGLEPQLLAALKSKGPVIPELGSMQSQAWLDFERRGLPTRKMESWHYTDVKNWFGPDFRGTAPAPAALPSLTNQKYHIWIRDGQVDGSRAKLPPGVQLVPFNEASRGDLLVDLKAEADRASLEHGGFTDLSLALLQDGVVIKVPENISVEEPVHLIMEWTSRLPAEVAASLSWFEVGKNSQLQVVEWNLGGAKRAVHQWTRFALEENSNVAYARVASGLAGSAVIGLLTVEQAAGSEFKGANLAHGGGLSRATWLIDQEGEGAATKLSGLAMGAGKDHLDLCSVVTHQVGRGTSEQRYRSLLNGSSRGIFSGKIVIAKDAQEVSSNQLSQNLLLSDRAEANTKPELEIYADNVKANHGATVGQLDLEHIFYLKSRGLRQKDAEHLLAAGFAMSSLDLFKTGDMKKILGQWIHDCLEEVIGEGASR